MCVCYTCCASLTCTHTGVITCLTNPLFLAVSLQCEEECVSHVALGVWVCVWDAGLFARARWPLPPASSPLADEHWTSEMWVLIYRCTHTHAHTYTCTQEKKSAFLVKWIKRCNLYQSFWGYYDCQSSVTNERDRNTVIVLIKQYPRLRIHHAACQDKFTCEWINNLMYYRLIC